MIRSVRRPNLAPVEGSTMARLIAGCGLIGVLCVAAIGARLDVLPILVGGVAMGVGTLVGLRWPILPLILFAALIPIEEVVVIDGFGTISRFAGILFAVTYAIPRLSRLKLSAMPLAAWGYIAWAVASVGWAIDPGTAAGQLVTLLQLFVIAVLIADFVVRQPAIVRPVLWAYSVSATAAALFGIQAFLVGGGRAAVFANQNPEHFAAALTPALIFGLNEVVNGKRRIVGAAIALVTTTAVIASGTRGAWIAVAVALLIMLTGLSPRRRIAMAGMAFALAVAVFQIPGVGDLISERAGSALATGGAGRTDIWAVAATIYQSSPFVGVGHANFPVAFTPEMVRASDVVTYARDVRGAHNLVILTIVELGPVGLLLLGAFLGPLILRRGWGAEALPVQAALVALVTQAMFVDMFANRKPIWLIIGFAAGLAYLRQRDRAAHGEEPDEISGQPVAIPPSPLAGGGRVSSLVLDRSGPWAAGPARADSSPGSAAPPRRARIDPAQSP
jgi:O-antigen ligase